MGLKEARKTVNNLRRWYDKSLYNERDQAAIILDDRVTELESKLNQEIDSVAEHIRLLGDRTQELNAVETQQDELEKKLAEYIAFSTAMKQDREAALRCADKADIEIGRLKAQRDELVDISREILISLEALETLGMKNIHLDRFRIAIKKAEGVALERKSKGEGK